MYKVFIALLLIVFVSCNGQSKTNSTDSSSTTMSDTSKSKIAEDAKQKAIDAQMAKGDRPDSEEDPSPADEKNRILKSYDDVKVIDTTLISGTDSLHFHLKYYCLKKSSLVVPKSYDTDKKSPKDFATHEFASDIILVNKKDTVLKKQFKASDFGPYFKDDFGGNLKKYGTILMPNLSRRNKDKSQVVLAYSIAIPTTDIGKGIFLMISKKGDYKVVENYNGQ